MNEKGILLECQKKFLFNSRYEASERSDNQKIPIYMCNKGRVNIYCDASDDLCIDDIIHIHKQMIDEMFKVCEKCKYRN